MHTALASFFLLAGTLLPASAMDSTPLIVPKPVSVIPQAGTFTITPATAIVADPACLPAAKILSDQLFKSTGFRIAINPPKAGSAITLNLLPGGADESYQLAATPSAVTLTAPRYSGIANGVQTLLQLLPAAVYSDHEMRDVTWSLPCVRIEDQPAYAWRGMMLDTSRYFLPKPSSSASGHHGRP